MGRPARNHGGTGGHGYPPLPGEVPNFNQHVLMDKTLQRLVPNMNQKPRITTRIDILTQLPKFGKQIERVNQPSDSVSNKVTKRAQFLLKTLDSS